ncbi:hypothetical protein MHH33_11030 [Paenisporosarcina sp. FSL H8-0542]|uniref:hypothetical protein n=1 Tax=Paenisporosarcina sp. FSL H8-0542 TaxID=2921401 RepID=UPI00315A3BA7
MIEMENLMSEGRVEKTVFTILGFAIAIVIFIFSGSVFWGVLISAEIVILVNFISSEKTKSSLIELLLYSLLAIGSAFILQAMYKN